jgi:hypothetical protein
MAIGNPGDVVTFLLNGTTTEAGIVIGGGTTNPANPDTTHNTVAYDFAVPNFGQIVHCKEYVTSSVTVVSALTD